MATTAAATADRWFDPSASYIDSDTSVPIPKFAARVPSAAPGSQGAASEHIGRM
jgi:hypothetical protein